MLKDILYKLFMFLITFIFTMLLFILTIGTPNNITSMQGVSDSHNYSHIYSILKGNLGDGLISSTQLSSYYYTDGYGILNRSSDAWDSCKVIGSENDYTVGESNENVYYSLNDALHELHTPPEAIQLYHELS